MLIYQINTKFSFVGDNMQIKYLETEYLNINSLTIIWKDSSIATVKLKKEINYWIANFDLPEGNYLYRLLINNCIILNDPESNLHFPDENNVIWSVLMIDSDGDRLFNHEQYGLNIKEYIITDSINNDYSPQNKKVFIPPADKIIATRFIFQNITGLHCISLLWITPDNEMFDICEDNLLSSDSLSDLTTIWFYLNLHTNGVSYPHGIWKIKLFIDGDFILEDEFEIKPAPIFLNQA